METVMKPLGAAARKVTSGSALPVSQRNSARAPSISYHAGNLPAALNYPVDVGIPYKLWSAWIPNDGSPRELYRPLRESEREALEARRAELAPALEPYGPADTDRVVTAISAMFGSFRSMRDRGADAVAALDNARRAVAPFPAWAVEIACAVIQNRGYEVEDRDGKRQERHWPPSDAEIVKAVEESVRIRAVALASASALLSAKVEAQHVRS